MSRERDLVRVSKHLSKVLRHAPDSIGLSLDANGWADVDELLARSPLCRDRATLEKIVATNDKQRFLLSADGARIRANQGHSVAVDVELTPQAPPAILYHGTAARTLPLIREGGLRPMRRLHVHLSADRETAERVGRRHGRPSVLEVDAEGMAAAGHAFFRSENGVWLCEAVPVAFLRFS